MACKIIEASKKANNWLIDFLSSSMETKVIQSDDINIGKGFFLDDMGRDSFTDINLLNVNRKGHVIGFGTTGAGKSRLIENMVEQDIYNDKSIVIIDPKIDNALLSRTYQACVRAGCEKDFMLLSPIHPHISVKINPMGQYFMPEEIIGHIVSAIETSGDVFFYNVALEVSTAIVHSRLLLKKYSKDYTPLNFRDIYKYTSYNGLMQLKENLQKINKKNDQHLEDIIILIENVMSSSQDYFAKVTSTLRTTLTQMSIGAIGKIIGSANHNKFIEKLENNERVILYVQTPSMLSKKTSDITAKVTLSMLQSCIGRKAIRNEEFTNGLSVYIDEASNCLYMGVENLFNKSRSTNTMITALSQNYADFVDAVGPEKARMILGNANGKIFLRLVDPDTAEAAAKYSGEFTKWDSMISTNGLMARQTKDTILKSEDFLKLKPREFFYFGMEGNFRGKTASVGDTEIRIIPPKNSLTSMGV